MDEHSPSLLERINNWFRTSVTLKLFIITFLVLIMLIPAGMIRSIISERQNLSNQTTGEVSDNWATSQQLTGPVFSVPVTYTKIVNGNTETETEFLHLLPDMLTVTGTVTPQILKRGIYDIVVYESDLLVKGGFDIAKIQPPHAGGIIKWEDAFLTIGISDMRGIKDRFDVLVNDDSARVIAGTKIYSMAGSGVNIPLRFNPQTDSASLQFNFGLRLQGSNNLSFIPVGNTTDVSITSAWNAPSFAGTFLPDDRTVNDNGFTAHWNILQLNRNYPQTWEGDQYFEEMHASEFGVDLIQSMDDYQKSMRSVKYAILTIALTFLVFFLTEVMNGRRIHPFQYILVGLALCLFYVLLVSLSEQMPFNNAYWIAASAIVVMITLYAKAVFSSLKLSAVLFLILSALYGFLFVTLQLSDYALLMGSIGLTIMLALTMYFTRKINWYAVVKKKE